MKGLPAVAGRETLFTTGLFFGNDFMTQILQSALGDVLDQDPSADMEHFCQLVGAALTGFLVAVATTPLDFASTVIKANPDGQVQISPKKHVSVKEYFLNVAKTQGVQGFFLGASFRGLIGLIAMVVLESCKHIDAGGLVKALQQPAAVSDDNPPHSENVEDESFFL